MYCLDNRFIDMCVDICTDRGCSMTLTQYQMVGLNWLALMHTQELNGILGDEMVGSYSVPCIANRNRSNRERLIWGIHGYTVEKLMLCSWRISQEELRSLPFSKDVLRVVSLVSIEIRVTYV